MLGKFTTHDPAEKTKGKIPGFAIFNFNAAPSLKFRVLISSTSSGKLSTTSLITEFPVFCAKTMGLVSISKSSTPGAADKVTFTPTSLATVEFSSALPVKLYFTV